MSVILGCAFAGSSILFSDSRVTIGGQKVTHRDELQKIFQLAPYLAVGFSSDNVVFTHQILKALTKYSYEKARSQNAAYLLNRLPRVAKYEYDKFSAVVKKAPAMDFIFAGVILDRMAKIPRDYFNELVKNQGGSFQVPKEILFGPQYSYNLEDGILCLPPASIVLRQSFPSGEKISTNCGGFAVAGSGAGVYEKILESWPRIFLIPHEFMRTTMLQTTLQDYRKEQKIDSVGGMIQIVQIDKKGVVPMGYDFGKMDKKGGEIWKQSMTFENGKWVQFDSRTNKKIIIQSNPLIFSQQTWDNEFPAAKNTK